MLKWLLSGLIILAFLFGMFTGKMEQVSNAALTGAANAVELTITLMGAMALWSGLMEIAQKAGICKKISKLLSPVICFIFKGVDKNSRACELISMNVTADMLGLANAATPLGIAALSELAKEEKADNILSTSGSILSASGSILSASDNMIKLVIVNTASIQLVPTTVGILRLKYGALNPFDIIPSVLISSVISLVAALLMAEILSSYQKSHHKFEKGH